ncbi:MAG: DUF4398 domain-containing protein [Treponema sp.]|jgi:hypothetical protein|nr:DUF4398 domain-containing protein [Treponema sp.]
MILCLAVLFLFFAGCARPPTAEMEAAEAAVSRAENDADTVTYAEGSLVRARDALSRMREEAAAKRYDAARTYAAEASAAAEKALADGKTGATLTREEAAALIEGLREQIPGTERNLRQAESAGNLDLDFDSLSRDFESARRDAAGAELSLAEEDYPAALQKGRGVRSALSDIDARIAGAASTASRKK